ncbi:hypothetical protein P8625_07830 [Tenacibaculum tangerinum]|uniref:Uncharacterized protein n=1 Tax=Tenacibaculum tangerinum TaxID=3038772 RepID=A0ABY8L6L5_9FLAO|nr:hypothetical protein [Tenacibaculum tangerinum]WGH77033.1 hypothetical protein P8625_07830 [Tenacibaculum tangerinum]
MRSKSFNTLITLSLCVIVTGCKSVKVKTNDKTNPNLSVGVFTGGLKKTAMVKSDEMPKKILVAENEKVFWIAGGSDESGLKSLTTEVVSGGLLRYQDKLLKKVSETNDTTATGLSKVGVLTSGELEFDSPTSKIILKSEAVDWAGNITFTPTVSVERIPKPIARLSTNTTLINRGENVQLTYETEHASNVFLNNTELTTFNGQRTVAPTSTTRYILRAENEVGTAQDTLVVSVNQPPTAPKILSFTSNKTTVKKGNQVVLNWNTSNTNRVKLFHNNSQIHSSSTSSGSKTIRLNNVGIQNFKLEASNNSNTVSTRLSVKVEPSTNCISYPYVGNFNISSRDNTAVVYEYPANNLFIGQRITSVKNPFNVDVRLNISGRESIISAGQTTTFFNGLGIGGRWVLLVPNPQPLIVKLIVCGDSN